MPGNPAADLNLPVTGQILLFECPRLAWTREQNNLGPLKIGGGIELHQFVDLRRRRQADEAFVSVDSRLVVARCVVQGGNDIGPLGVIRVVDRSVAELQSSRSEGGIRCERNTRHCDGKEQEKSHADVSRRNAAGKWEQLARFHFRRREVLISPRQFARTFAISVADRAE